jgi:thiol:disulfide interchange protein DsbD
MLKAVIGLTSLAIGLWVYGRWCTIAKAKRTRKIGFAVAIIFTALGLAASKPPAKGMKWEVWSPEVVQQALEEGRPVYVDFTATWCVTCQVNKGRAYPRKIQDLFKAHNILPLKADYTNYSPEIGKAIDELGRNAVPVNVLYVPGEENPHLTEELFGSKYMGTFIKEHLGEPDAPKDAPKRTDE